MGETMQKIIQFSAFFPYALTEEQLHIVYWDLKRYMWKEHGILFDTATEMEKPTEVA